MKVRRLLPFFLLPFLSVSARSTPAAEDLLHVNLSRIDGNGSGVFTSFNYDQEWVGGLLQKYSVKLPADMKGMSFAVQPTIMIFALMRRLPGKEAYSVILDANANLDLTDDPPIELGLGGAKEWKRVDVKRNFTVPDKHSVLLPCFISLDENILSDGSRLPVLLLRANYSFAGDFRYKGTPYQLLVRDDFATGKFSRDWLDGVTYKAQPIGQSGGESAWGKPTDLVLVGDDYFEFREIAVDGSWIEFGKSELPRAALGVQAPDMTLTDATGKEFKLSDYRGHVLLLDFWASWCKPCIARFPAIKKIAESYGPKGLVVIGINLDLQENVAKAAKVIADYNLDWRHVVPGLGEAVPSRQVFMRLTEAPRGFPIYVVIDDSGLAAYASNDFNNIERFLENRFAEPEKRRDSLFVPVTVEWRKLRTGPPVPVDFSAARLSAHLNGRKAALAGTVGVGGRLGLLPDDTLVYVVQADASRLKVVVDTNRNLDLRDETFVYVPVTARAEPAPEEAVEVRYMRPMRNRDIYSANYRFIARSANPARPAELCFLGSELFYSGRFGAGGKEYRVSWCDPSNDEMITLKEVARPGVLKLFVRNGEIWDLLHEGTERIPIGGALYRAVYISETGNLLELQKEK